MRSRFGVRRPGKRSSPGESIRTTIPGAACGLTRATSLQNASAGNILSQYSQDGQLLQITDNRSGFTSSYISLGGSLVAVRKKAISGGAITVEYQHTDALGTPVAVTSSTRAVLERSEYEPYGQLLNRAQHDGPGFTGHMQDALTGLTYMQQRYYDPMIGRFLSVDPVTATSIGGNFNRYWYGNDNPYRFVDRDGRCTGSLFSNNDGTCLGSGGFTTQSVGPWRCPACDKAGDRTTKPNPITSKKNNNQDASKKNNDQERTTSSQTNESRGMGWTRPANHKYTVGREGNPLVSPGEGIGKFIDDYVPAGHTFGANHDAFVGWAVGKGVPDALINIPSMPALYAISAGEEAINTPARIQIAIFGTNFTPLIEHTDP